MDFKSIIAKLKPKSVSVGSKSLKLNQSLVLWAVTGVVLLADLWALQSSLLALYRVRFEDVGAREVESTRVNFQSLQKATERVKQADSYVPEAAPGLNPFKEVPKQIK